MTCLERRHGGRGDRNKGGEFTRGGRSAPGTGGGAPGDKEVQRAVQSSRVT